MIEVRQTRQFREWLGRLADDRARERIAQRLVRIAAGLIGDIKPVGGGISELRIDHGPGYRLYLVQRGRVLVVLLWGGDGSSQARDIRRAKEMAENLEQL